MQTRGTSSFGLNSTLSSRCSVVKQGRTWPGLKLGAHWISDKSAYFFFVVSVDKRWRNLHVLQACTDFFFLYVAQTYTVDIENITLKMQTHRALLVQCPNLLRHFPSSFPNAIFHALTSLLLFLPTLCRTFNQRPSSILTPIADHQTPGLYEWFTSTGFARLYSSATLSQLYNRWDLVAQKSF